MYFLLAPSWMCGSSSTASLVLCSQELRNVIGSYLAQSSGGDVKECSLLRTKIGSCRQSLSTGRAQSRGVRLLPRWGGDVWNRDGQGSACWTIWLKLSKCWSFNDFNDPPPGFWFSQRAPQPTALPSSASSEFFSVCTWWIYFYSITSIHLIHYCHSGQGPSSQDGLFRWWFDFIISKTKPDPVKTFSGGNLLSWPWCHLDRNPRLSLRIPGWSHDNRLWWW